MTPVPLVVPWRALFAVLLAQTVSGTLPLPAEHVHRADDAHRSSIVHRHSATHQADHHDDRDDVSLTEDDVSLTEVEGQVVWLSAVFLGQDYARSPDPASVVTAIPTFDPLLPRTIARHRPRSIQLHGPPQHRASLRAPPLSRLS